MATIFEDATNSLNDTCERVAGVPITLARGGITFDTVAVLGRTVYAQGRQGHGPAVVWGERDFLVRVGEYRLGPAGEACEPAEFDRVLDQTTNITYEVRRIADEPAYRYDAPERLTWRVHTKRITLDP